MTTQQERAEAFAALHVKGNPVILYNVWDAGSAKAIAEVGAKAIATGSHSVAGAYGYADGQNVPLDMVIENARRIVAAVDLPVTIDFEGGYGVSAEELNGPIMRLVETGAIGINFEDQVLADAKHRGGGGPIYPIAEQVARIAAIRAAAESAGVALFINARTDVFLKSTPDTHESHMAEVIDRASAYRDAGASGFFAPGLRDAGLIGRLVEASPLPVNIMVMPDVPSNAEMAKLGVARISYGGGPYRVAMAAFKAAGREALDG
jgi:2-methylisocitrate lyase-like PEP mutase family enzyme